MAVQVTSERAIEVSRPNLRVIDLRPSRPADLDAHPQIIQLRRRRLARRLHRAVSAITWTGAAVVLLFVLVGGLAGLR